MCFRLYLVVRCSHFCELSLLKLRFSQLMLFHPSTHCCLCCPVAVCDECLCGAIIQERLDLNPVLIQLALPYPSWSAELQPLCCPCFQGLFGSLGDEIPFNFRGHGECHGDNLALDAGIYTPVGLSVVFVRKDTMYQITTEGIGE